MNLWPKGLIPNSCFKSYDDNCDKISPEMRFTTKFSEYSPSW